MIGGEMREITFRAWNHTDEQMIYQDFYQDTYKAKTKSLRKIKSIRDFWFLSLSHKWKIMQYTGLKDRGGREIYEGDIIRGIAEHNSQFEVFYGYGQWQPFAYLGSWDSDDYEVVGNIYEHPNLFRGKKIY